MEWNENPTCHEVAFSLAVRDAAGPDVKDTHRGVAEDEAFPQRIVVAAAGFRGRDELRVADVLVDGGHELLLVVGAAHDERGAFGRLKGGQQQCRQDRDDRDHDEELDERESAGDPG